MRCCLSFLAVEFMRQGHSPQEACSMAIQRLQQLHDAHPPAENMHSTLVVGIVAMDRDGRVGAASTLGEENLHRGEAFFPVVCWRRQGGTEDSFVVIKADRNGASF